MFLHMENEVTSFTEMALKVLLLSANKFTNRTILCNQQHQDSLCLTFELIVTFHPISNNIYKCLSNVDIKEARAIINLVQLLQMYNYINICMAVNTFDVDVCQQ